METSETRWFKIVSFIGIAIVLGFAIANLVYYTRLKNGSTPTQNEIESMIWINVFLIFIASVLFLWCLIRLLVSVETRKRINTYLNAKGAIVE